MNIDKLDKYGIIEEARYMIDNKNTIREASRYFGVSIGKIHKDINKLLPYIDNELYKEIRKLSEYNKRNSGKRDNKVNPLFRKVIRLSDKKVYKSIKEASIDCKCDRGTIRSHCDGKVKNKRFSYI